MTRSRTPPQPARRRRKTQVSDESMCIPRAALRRVHEAGVRAAPSLRRRRALPPRSTAAARDTLQWSLEGVLSEALQDSAAVAAHAGRRMPRDDDLALLIAIRGRRGPLA